MSGTIATSLPAAPTTLDVAQQILATMQALSGVATDYNIGSQVRTYSEATGSVIEMQSVAAQQQAYLGLTYGSISAYGIKPFGAQVSNGFATFSTSSSGSPPPATQNVTISIGTLLQTSGGVQFQTTQLATLTAGSASVIVPIQAVQGGSQGNVTSGQIVNIITGLGYPLYVTNASATTGGAAAESPSATLARFAAAQGALGLASPYAVANSAIGVTVGAETCEYANCYEPWLAALLAGNSGASGTAGFILYIDNGQGTASTALINAVTAKITGNQTAGQPGNRPVGMPFSVQAITPIYANVAVTGTLLQYIQAPSVEVNIESAINNYFDATQIDGEIQLPQLSAATANAGEGYFVSLAVVLSFASGGGPVTFIPASYKTRVILQGLTQTISTVS